MTPIKHVAGRAIPFGRKNVDTDVIIPSQYLKTITREGLGRGAFEALRKDKGNIFDAPEYAGAPILLAGDNFGCGSSREHAAWALLDMGITCVIAPSFSDIFSGNAFKNGILTVVLPQEAVDPGHQRNARPHRHRSGNANRHHPVSGPLHLRDRSFPQALPAGRSGRGGANAGAGRSYHRA